MKVPDEILACIRDYERTGSRGPWTAVGCRLYFGPAQDGIAHQELPRAEDARLMAVARSWFIDILDDLEEAKATIADLKDDLNAE